MSARATAAPLPADQGAILLTVNAGSSSVRLAAFDRGGAPRRRVHRDLAAGSADALIRSFLEETGTGAVRAVAHRVVHGGPALAAPRLIDDAVEAEIERAAPLAPLHNPAALRLMRACRALLGPGVPQIAAFDTGFYAGLPAETGYALPRDLVARHRIRRYGFHGLAHQCMWRRLCALRPALAGCGRAVSLQLGAGCSATAIRGGRPVDTSMGFSPSEGLVMATRAGDVDPGLLTFLQRAEGLDAAALERLLTRESGLRGASGLSGDAQVLLRSAEPAAQAALAMFCHRARRYLGAYLAVLGGADAVVFGGGIGEHAAPLRARILAGLAFCGLLLDEEANAAAVGREALISRTESHIEVWVLPVDEEALLADAARSLLAEEPHDEPSA